MSRYGAAAAYAMLLLGCGGGPTQLTSEVDVSADDAGTVPDARSGEGGPATDSGRDIEEPADEDAALTDASDAPTSVDSGPPDVASDSSPAPCGPPPPPCSSCI